MERVYDAPVDTEYGGFRLCCYEDHVNKTVHIALVKGDLNSSLPPLVRVHINHTLRDVVGVSGEKLGWPLRSAMRRVAKEDSGVVVILRSEESPRDFMEKLMHLDAKPAHPPVGATVVRTYGIGDPQGSGLEAHAGLERAQAAARAGRLRSGNHQLCGRRCLSAAGQASGANHS